MSGIDLAKLGLEPGTLLNLVIALVILVVGWVVARVLAAMVSRVLRALKVDERLRGIAGGEAVRLEPIAGTIVFYVAMLGVLVLFFQQLQLTAITDPLNSLLETVLLYVPRIALAALLLLAAWLVATIIRTLVTRMAAASRIDARLAEQADMDTDQPLAVSSSLASAAYYLVFLFFLPGILGVLQLERLAQPLEDMLSQILEFLPNLLGAVLIFLIGYFVARIVRQLVTNLLVAGGVDRLTERLGIADGVRISSLLGTAAYALILVPVAISALEQLKLDAVSQPAVRMLEQIGQAIPGILAAVVILAVSWFVGRLVSDLVTSLLSSAGFDRVLAALGLKPNVGLAAGRERSPSEIAGYVVLVLIMLFATMEAAESIGFGALRGIIESLLGFAAQALLATIVFGVGLYLANFLRSVIADSGFGGSNNALLANLARVVVILLTGLTALSELEVGGTLLTQVTLVVLGAIGLAFAIAFGMGGREVASDFLRRRVGR